MRDFFITAGAGIYDWGIWLLDGFASLFLTGYGAYAEMAQGLGRTLAEVIGPLKPAIAASLRIEALDCSGTGCVTDIVLIPVIVVLLSWVAFLALVYGLRRLMGASGRRPLVLQGVVLAVLLTMVSAAFELGDDIALLRDAGLELAETTLARL